MFITTTCRRPLQATQVTMAAITMKPSAYNDWLATCRYVQLTLSRNDNPILPTGSYKSLQGGPRPEVLCLLVSRIHGLPRVRSQSVSPVTSVSRLHASHHIVTKF
jgi:hypothetical protein